METVLASTMTKVQHASQTTAQPVNDLPLFGMKGARYKLFLVGTPTRGYVANRDILVWVKLSPECNPGSNFFKSGVFLQLCARMRKVMETNVIAKKMLQP